MRQLKLLPGTMLLMLASTLSINPVSAQQIPASGTGEVQNPTNTITPQTPSRTNTQPAQTPMQMESSPSAPSSTPMQMERQVVPSSETSTNTVSGTVRSIEGQLVTLEMADGMTKQMTVSSADLQRLNLREGMEISATVDAQSVASNITLAQASTTNTGSEATTSQTGTTSTTTEATTTTEVDDTSATPATTTESTSTTVESTPANRPVRALW